MSTPKTPLVVRFWRRVKKTAGCWLWLGALDRDGYGEMADDLGIVERSNRLAWRLATRSDAGDLHVLHRCDNPSCVRPDHLFLGTNLDNISDMVSKGRHAKGSTHGRTTSPERTARGEVHGNARLDDAKVREIRALHASGVGQEEIARRFGVRQGTISFVVLRQTWKHVA